MILDGQISFAELLSPAKAENPSWNGLRAVGDLIGRRVLGEVRTAHITEIEGLPYFPFYRTDSGGCYDVKEKEIEEHMQVRGACPEDEEHPMRRLYWSVHGFYADAECVKTNG